MATAVIEPEPEPVPLEWGEGRSADGHRDPGAVGHADRSLRTRRLARGDPRSLCHGLPGRIYAIFTYCVRHRDDVNPHLAARDTRRTEIKVEVEARFPPEGLRAKPLARLGR